jgi:hypothetical protein
LLQSIGQLLGLSPSWAPDPQTPSGKQDDLAREAEQARRIRFVEFFLREWPGSDHQLWGKVIGNVVPPDVSEHDLARLFSTPAMRANTEQFIRWYESIKDTHSLDEIQHIIAAYQQPKSPNSPLRTALSFLLGAFTGGVFQPLAEPESTSTLPRLPANVSISMLHLEDMWERTKNAIVYCLCIAALASGISLFEDRARSAHVVWILALFSVLALLVYANYWLTRFRIRAGFFGGTNEEARQLVGFILSNREQFGDDGDRRIFEDPVKPAPRVWTLAGHRPSQAR